MSKLDLQAVKNIISSRKLVDKPMTYSGKVTSVTARVDDEGRPFWIVNLNMMTQYQLTEALKLAKAGDFDAATNQAISTRVRIGQYLPNKGETIKVVIDTVTTKKGITGLFVTSISEITAVSGANIDFGAMFDEKPVEETPVVDDFTTLEDGSIVDETTGEVTDPALAGEEQEELVGEESSEENPF